MVSYEKEICVITDNEYLYDEFKKIIKNEKYNIFLFDFFCSPNSEILEEKQNTQRMINRISIKDILPSFWKKYDLIISLHCKQLFTKEMVENNRCVNIHPGYNPYNRGWYPQVFSIINKLPAGVTIHEMDSELDHGNIIFQEEIKIYEYDTSWDVYKRILQKEIKMIQDHLEELIFGNYSTIKPMEGNINQRKDFNKMLEIDLDKVVTYREAIDFLRAMTFPRYNNAYFLDKEGNKVYVQITLKKMK